MLEIPRLSMKAFRVLCGAGIVFIFFGGHGCSQRFFFQFLGIVDDFCHFGRRDFATKRQAVFFKTVIAQVFEFISVVAGKFFAADSAFLLGLDFVLFLFMNYMD